MHTHQVDKGCATCIGSPWLYRCHPQHTPDAHGTPIEQIPCLGRKHLYVESSDRMTTRCNCSTHQGQFRPRKSFKYIVLYSPSNSDGTSPHWCAMRYGDTGTGSFTRTVLNTTILMRRRYRTRKLCADQQRTSRHSACAQRGVRAPGRTEVVLLNVFMWLRVFRLCRLITCMSVCCSDW